MFNDEDILKLKKFNQTITERPRPMEAQKHVREGVFLWCDDWEIIELNKYMFNGKDAYFGDPPPNRLKNNPLWSKEDISQKAEQLIEKFKTADAIIEALKERRNGT